jgi:WD40 repeat protein
MAKNSNKSSSHPLLTERNIYLLLIVVGILIRIPIFNYFDMVTYDGTYYIHDARSILGEVFPPSPFPVGYPALIALFIPFFRNGVLAARIISIIAGVGLPLIIYKLARHYIKKIEALAAALFVLFTPLCVRMSMITMSESIYVFWLFLGLLFFARRKELSSGVLMGLAAITRPEALGVLGVLALLRLRRPKQLLLILAGFSVVYSVNIAVQSRIAGELVLISKTKFFGTHAESWKVREDWIDSREKEEFKERTIVNEGEKNLLEDYIETVPGEFILLIKHASVILFLFALYGIYRKRVFLLASFVPFLIYPLFTVRRETRLVLPYIPGIVLYAMIGLSTIRKERARVVIYILLSLSVLSGVVINRDQLTRPVAAGFRWAKETGRLFSEYVKPGEKIADRKPYFAFYSGGRYLEIPVGHYNRIMDYLVDENVEYLACHKQLIHQLRPGLRGFLYDEVLINGEFRYSQIYFRPGLLAVYKRTPGYKPLIRQNLLQPRRRKLFGLIWSPDGKKIAYRENDLSGRNGIYVLSPEGGPGELAIELVPIGSLSWSPDSKSIVCSLRQGDNIDIYICHLTGGVERVTSHEAVDTDPSWSKDGTEIAFVSERSGGSDICIKNLKSGTLTFVTKSGINGYPAISPDGTRLAWIRKGEGLIIYDRSSESGKLVDMGKNVHFPPAWSPDGSYLMMTRSGGGKTNVCLMSSDGENVIQLTGSDLDEGSPAWRPDGKAAAVFTNQGGKVGIRIISGMDHYFDRIARMKNGRSNIPRAFKKNS